MTTDAKSMSMLDGLDDGDLEDNFLDEEVEYQSKVDEERDRKRELAKKLSGRLREFRMPPKPNGDNNTRVAVVRFFRDIKKNVKMLHHEAVWVEKKGKGKAADTWRTFCLAEIGLPCEYCEKICKKHDITREFLLDKEHQERLFEYANPDDFEFKTTWMHSWYVWHYDDNNGEGGVRIFMWAYNKSTPLQRLYTLNKLRVDGAIEKGKKPHELNEYDVILIQSKEGREREFDVHGDDYEPFDEKKLAEALKIIKHPPDLRHLRWDAFMARVWDADELKKLRKMAAEALNDDSYLVIEENESAIRNPKAKSKANGYRQSDDEEEASKTNVTSKTTSQRRSVAPTVDDDDDDAWDVGELDEDE